MTKTPVVLDTTFPDCCLDSLCSLTIDNKAGDLCRCPKCKTAYQLLFEGKTCQLVWTLLAK